LKSDKVKRLLQGVHSVEFAIAGFGLVVTNIMMFVQVINRYWLHLPLLGIGDLTFYCFIIFMSIAAIVATWRESHVAVDALRDQFLKHSPRGLKIHSIAVSAVALVVFAIFLPRVISFMQGAIEYPKWATLVRWFNLSWLHLIWGVCMLLVFLHLIEVLWRHTSELRAMRKAERGEP
jgi:TRAP-type C4-dicarboxylate transport system permease small subunit